MKLSVGIVGLPNVGKSTLFKILTNQEVNVANYPFATIDPNVGIVTVPDERLQKLAYLSQSSKIVPAVVEFYDIAGLVKGANRGEGLGNQFLAHIRNTQVIVIVLRVFQNPEIIHVENSVDAERDLEIINSELILKDLETISKKIEKLEKEAKGGDKKSAKNLEILKSIREALNRGELALKFKDEEIVHELQLLTAKKQIYLLNGEEKDIDLELKKKIKSIGGDYIVANLLNYLNDKILHSNKNNPLADLIKKAYEILDLISFFTTGRDETRAWTVKRGTKAPQAAGVIHSDFERKFIRMEAISWERLISAGGWNEAKQKGLVRLEGRDYEVQDGDVIVVRHS